MAKSYYGWSSFQSSTISQNLRGKKKHSFKQRFPILTPWFMCNFFIGEKALLAPSIRYPIWYPWHSYDIKDTQKNSHTTFELWMSRLHHLCHLTLSTINKGQFPCAPPTKYFVKNSDQVRFSCGLWDPFNNFFWGGDTLRVAWLVMDPHLVDSNDTLILFYFCY